MNALFVMVVLLSQGAAKEEVAGVLESIDPVARRLAVKTEDGVRAFRYDASLRHTLNRGDEKTGGWKPPAIGTLLRVEPGASGFARSIRTFNYPLLSLRLDEEKTTRLRLPGIVDLPFEAPGRATVRRSLRVYCSLQDNGVAIYEMDILPPPNRDMVDSVRIVCDGRELVYKDLTWLPEGISFYLPLTEIATIAGAKALTIHLGDEEASLYPEEIGAIRELFVRVGRERPAKRHEIVRKPDRPDGRACLDVQLLEEMELRRPADGDKTDGGFFITVDVGADGFSCRLRYFADWLRPEVRFATVGAMSLKTPQQTYPLSRVRYTTWTDANGRKYEIIIGDFKFDDLPTIADQGEVIFRVGDYEGRIASDELPAFRTLHAAALAEQQRQKKK